MLRYFRLNWFELCMIRRATRNSWVIFIVVGFAAALMAGPEVIGQESGSDRDKNSVFGEDESGADLRAAIRSLDDTLNNKEVLNERKTTRDRLVGFGACGVAFLALMGVLFGYLRLDHATRGFHSGRLQMLSAFLAILILVTCYLLWTQVLFK